MIKETIYTYLGTNGTVTTPIHLEGLQAMIQYRLFADEGKTLTDGTRKVDTITVLPGDVNKWSEVDA